MLRVLIVGNIKKQGLIKKIRKNNLKSKDFSFEKLFEISKMSVYARCQSKKKYNIQKFRRYISIN
jgi:hypothetical protein